MGIKSTLSTRWIQHNISKVIWRLERLKKVTFWVIPIVKVLSNNSWLPRVYFLNLVKELGVIRLEKSSLFYYLFVSGSLASLGENWVGDNFFIYHSRKAPTATYIKNLWCLKYENPRSLILVLCRAVPTSSGSIKVTFSNKGELS